MASDSPRPAWEPEILTEKAHGAQLRRAVLASTIGTTIEWYDFFLYSAVTGLVFAKLSFPHSAPLIGTLEAFGVYAVGFAARPIGAAIFGHWGDRLGHKSALIATLMLMGVATFRVGVVAGYDLIGVWGAVILTILRFVQGVGVGGEWGGSVLLSMEWARDLHQRLRDHQRYRHGDDEGPHEPGHLGGIRPAGVTPTTVCADIFFVIPAKAGTQGSGMRFGACNPGCPLSRA